MAMHNGTVNGTGWHQAGGDKASATALLVNSIRNSPTQQLVGQATSLANQLQAINHQSLSSSPVLQQLTTQQQQQVQAAQQQQQQYASGISEQNYGGTTYFIPENQKQTHVVYPPYMAYPGVPTDTSVAFMERTTQMKVNARTSFFVGEEYRQYINNRINESQASLASEDGPAKPFPDVTPQNSNSKESYHGLFPLEQLLEQKSQTLNAQTSTFRATKVEDGLNYCLKRIHGIRNHSMDGYKNLQKWTSIRTANIVSLHTVFTIKAFGDQSIMFVYDFHPAAETLMQRHFMQSPFYNKKRQQQNQINEPLIWTYIVQLTAALRALHSKDLAYRQMYPTNILISGKSRLRLNYPAVSDILSGNAEDVLRCQQEDLIHLGRVILGLCVNSSQPFQGDQQIIAQCMEMVRKNYSIDLCNLITYLLQPIQKRRSVDALMPMIGARFYTQLDSAYLWGDMIEGELEKEVENGRLFRLMCKLGSVNERPHLSSSVSNHDQSWAESGDRFLIRMFRAYLFRQVQDGQSWLELSHIVAALNKLDVGSEEKVMLQSQDEQNVILVTYKDLKKALNKCFNDLYLQNAKDQRNQML